MTTRKHLKSLIDAHGEAIEALSDIRATAKMELEGCEEKVDFASAVISRVDDVMDDSDDESRSSAEE